MTVTKADGTILINTKINTDGFAKGGVEVKRQFSEMAASAKAASVQIESALSGSFSKPVEMAKLKVDSLEREYAAVSESLKSAIAADDDSSAARLGEKQIAVYNRLEEARERLRIEVAEAAKKQTDDEIREAERSRKAIEKQATAKNRAEEKGRKARMKEYNQTFKANKSMSALEKSTGKFGRRLSSIVTGALFFNVISSALSSLTREMWSTISSTSEMKTALSNLKGAASTAAAPLVNVLSKAFASLANTIATALSYITRFYSILTGKSVTSLSESAKQMNNFASGAAKAKKSLAGFDEITALQDKNSGGGGGSILPNYDFGLEGGNDEGLVAVAEKLKQLFDPLKDIDLSNLGNSVKDLGGSLADLGGTISEDLEWVWFNVLVPLSKWTIEKAAPKSVDTLTSSANLCSTAIEGISAAFESMHEHMTPVFDFLGESGLMILDQLKTRFDTLASTINEKTPQISNAFDNVGKMFEWVWKNILQPVLTELRNIYVETMGLITGVTDNNVRSIIDVFEGLTEFLLGAFTGDWDRAFEGLKQAGHAWVNSMIGMINGMLSAFVGGLNGIIRTINKVKITIPDWVPEIGGRSYGFNFKTVSAPQIPYLAKGAVIPPNAPFMAVLGDQRHGTNIEAPLETIQQAFRAEVADMVGGMMAGFEASVQVQNQILEAVLAIEIGDTTIGEAAARYSTKQSIIHGG